MVIKSDNPNMLLYLCPAYAGKIVIPRLTLINFFFKLYAMCIHYCKQAIEI